MKLINKYSKSAAIAEQVKIDTAQANDQMMTVMRSIIGKDSAATSMFQNVFMLTCDSACQKRQKADELRNAWKAAAETEKNALTTTAEAEKILCFYRGHTRL